MSNRHHTAYEPLQLAKILRIRAELAAGTYHVSTGQLAEAMMQRAQESPGETAQAEQGRSR